MNFVKVQGSAELLSDLGDIAGLDLIHKSAVELDSGDLSIAAFATDAGITDVEARGATVEIIMDAAALQAHYDELDAIIAAKEPVG